MDRTDEFFALVRRHRGTVVTTATTMPMMIQQSNRLLYTSTQRLAELTALVRQPPRPFTNTEVQVDKLIHAVKMDIDAINRALTTLRDDANHLTSDARMHQDGKILTLATHLRDTQSGFGEALFTRAEMCRAMDKRRQHTGAVSSVRVEPVQEVEKEELSVAITIPRQDDNHDLLAARARQIQDIEGQIIEVGEAMKKMNEIVLIHGETIARIEDNVMESEVHAENAHHQLLQYLASIKSNRWLMIKLFGVLLLFIVLFVVFML